MLVKQKDFVVVSSLGGILDALSLAIWMHFGRVLKEAVCNMSSRKSQS